MPDVQWGLWVTGRYRQSTEAPKRGNHTSEEFAAFLGLVFEVESLGLRSVVLGCLP